MGITVNIKRRNWPGNLRGAGCDCAAGGGDMRRLICGVVTDGRPGVLAATIAQIVACFASTAYSAEETGLLAALSSPWFELHQLPQRPLKWPCSASLSSGLMFSQCWRRSFQRP